MRLHRVTWVDPRWESLRAHQPYHPLYVPLDRQGGGRFDNPHRYAAMYGATTPAAAVGESFANSATWLAAEIQRSKDGHPRCLVRFDVDESTLLDLDDPAVLADLGIRPTDVVRRNRNHTQEIGFRIWIERRPLGVAGLRWWSYWRPEWEVALIWSSGPDPPWFPGVDVVDVEPLTIVHPAVRLAADVLPRQLARP